MANGIAPRIREFLRAIGLGRSYRSIHLQGWKQAHAGQGAIAEPLGNSDVIAFLRTAGLVPGDTLWLQSNWNVLGGHKIEPVGLIRDLVDLVGPAGHIMMPAFVDPRDKSRQPVDFGVLPSSTGLLTEIFRRWPGVVRSVDLDSSMTILGPDAHAIADRARTEEIPWSPASTPAFMQETNALAVSIGFGDSPAFLSPLHLLDGQYPDAFGALKVFDPAHVSTYTWIDPEGQAGSRRIFHRQGRVNTHILGHFIAPATYHRQVFDNGCFVAMRTRDLLDAGRALLGRSISQYDRSLVLSRIRHSYTRARLLQEP